MSDETTLQMPRKTGPGQGWRGLLRRFVSEKRGAVAVQFAVLVLPLAVLSLGLIDVNRASMSKRTLQDALDASALIAAKSTAITDTDINTIGQAALAAQLSGSDAGALITSNFKLGGTNNSTVIASASSSVDPVVADLWLHGNMTVGAKSEVLRASYNLEVALVLDVTNSMAGTKISDLKVAAADLVDIVVKDAQTPYYSKMSIVPYSMAVNLGTSATTARGAVTTGKSITGASWAVGSAKTISGATKANPVVITASSHGFSNGDRVYISGVSGMTQLNGKVYTVANKATNTFQLSGVNGTNYSTFSSSGSPRVTECQVSDCTIVVTANGHGLSNGAVSYITGVGGMTSLNSNTWTVANSTTNTYSLAEAFGPSQSSYSSGGTSYCTTAGCEYYRFFNSDGTEKVFQISTCVSERTGTNAFTDVSPATALLGRNYPASSNPCLTNTITPLTATKTTLKTAITALAASGSTGGHIGVGWGWYSISPNFGSIFTGTSLPASYTAPKMMKVLILMTDGEYNSSYCNGVISQSSTTGSGAATDHINCDAPNGSAYVQATSLCTAMKAKGVIVYTVGFQVVADQRATDLVNNCATDSSHIYLPANGTALKAAFKAIGQDISSLRISK
jgi:Flp pilus assembly protein TadG